MIFNQVDSGTQKHAPTNVHSGVDDEFRGCKGNSIGIEKKWKTPVKVCAPSHPITAQLAMVSPAKVAAPHKKRTPAFNPRIVLTKHSVGTVGEEYQADESVYSQGDAADAVFYIERGTVKLSVVSERGKPAVVAILTKASFFGEGCLAGQLHCTSTASTVQRTTILRVPKQTMLTLLHQEPEFAEHFLTHLLSRNIRMEADLMDHHFNTSEKRLARLLLLLAHFDEESKPTTLIAKISQDTLALMIGTTRSRVSCFLNQFRKSGFIDYGEGGMHVHSSLVSVMLRD
jgi:CRP-like cAMP-binding protein